MPTTSRAIAILVFVIASVALPSFTLPTNPEALLLRWLCNPTLRGTTARTSNRDAQLYSTGQVTTPLTWRPSSGISMWKPLDKFASTSDAARFYVIEDRHVYTRYVLSGDKVQYDLIPDADPASFKVSTMDDAYSLDISAVFYSGKRLALADPSSFHLLIDDRGGQGPNHFAADSSHVWCYQTMIIGADPSHFTLIADSQATATGFATDKRHVYYCSQLITAADPVTFSSINDTGGNGTGFAKDKIHVFVVDGLAGAVVVPGANPASFRAYNFSDGYNTGYGKDGSHVYYYSRLMPAADSVTFTAATSTTSIQSYFRGWDSYDRDHRFFEGLTVAARY